MAGLRETGGEKPPFHTTTGKSGGLKEIATPEVAVLACCLRSAEAAWYVMDHAEGQDFISDPAVSLFALFRMKLARGKVLDPTTIMASIAQDATHREDVRAFREKVMAVELNPEKHTKQYVEELKEWAHDWKIRSAIEQAYDRSVAGYTPTENKRYLLRDLDRIEAGLGAHKSFDDHATLHGALCERLLDPTSRGLSWGYERIDRHIRPLLPGNMALLGGPSGAGKSTVARNLILQWVASGQRVAAMTSEMPYDEQVYNYSSMVTGIPVDRIWTMDLSVPERHAIMAISRRMKDRLLINQKGDITPEYVLHTFRRYAQMGYQILVLDHLHRVSYPGREDNLRHEIGGLAMRLKSLAQDMGVIMLTLVQLRKPERGRDEPNDEDIRESGKIVEEADKVLFAYRKRVWGTTGAGGAFVPLDRGVPPHRFFEDDFGSAGGKNPPPEGAYLGKDEGFVYLKAGKQRVRPKEVTIQLPFEPETGLILGGNVDIRERALVAQYRERQLALASEAPSPEGLLGQARPDAVPEGAAPEAPEALGGGLRDGV